MYSIFRHARDIARVTCCQPWSDFRDFITTCANTPRQPDKIDTSAISPVADPLDATRSNVAILGVGSWTAFDIDNNEAASSTPFRAIDGRLKGKCPIQGTDSVSRRSDRLDHLTIAENVTALALPVVMPDGCHVVRTLRTLLDLDQEQDAVTAAREPLEWRTAL
jgi:hypothetical protein